MKLRKKPCGSPTQFFLISLSLLTGIFVAPAVEATLVADLLFFQESSRHDDECLLISAKSSESSVTLYESPNKSSAIFKRAPEGERCRILKEKDQDGGEVWLKVERFPQGKRAKDPVWVPLFSVVRRQAMKASKDRTVAVVTFAPTCSGFPCPVSALIIRPEQRVRLDIGHGTVSLDRKGENIFFSRLEEKKDDNGVGYYESALYRYDIQGQLLQRIGNGLAPVSHPMRDWIIYRDFRGAVFLSDYSGLASRKIFEPEENMSIYRTPDGHLSPPPQENLRTKGRGVTPTTVPLFVAKPETGNLPTPVEFFANDKIRFQVAYADGSIQATVQKDLDPEEIERAPEQKPKKKSRRR